MQSFLLSLLMAVLMAAGCAAPTPMALSPLDHLADEISRFPEQVGPYQRVGWEFDRRSITAHYRTVRGVATAWITRTIVERDQDPHLYVAKELLLLGLRSREPKAQAEEEGTLSYEGQRFTYIQYRVPKEKQVGTGCVAGTVLPQLRGKHHVLLVQGFSQLEERDPKELIRPLVAAVLRE
ncbi:MAG: hypothetical protein V3T77_03950 [Planctomycetota bacterium]